jgi:predicted deacylase
VGVSEGAVVAGVDGVVMVVRRRGGGRGGDVDGGGGGDELAGDVAIRFVMHCHTKIT